MRTTFASLSGRVTSPDRAPVPDGAPTRNPEGAGLGAYAKAATRNCPYLGPAMCSGQVWWTRYRMPPGMVCEAAEAAVFAAGVRAAERVREHLARGDGDRLACEVVGVDWPGSPDRRHSVLDWPHWALKHLYAPVGVMTGKFAPGATDRDRRGTAIAAPPIPVLALRAALPRKDARFLTRTPKLAEVMARARDDGRDVFASVPGMPLGTDPARAWPTVRAWAASLPRDQWKDTEER